MPKGKARVKAAKAVAAHQGRTAKAQQQRRDQRPAGQRTGRPA